ncbi:MAG: hypothetical protein PVG69_03715, partial [Desulfobacterales bacterium]
IKMTSQPCRFIDKEGRECPGNIEECSPPENAKDCQNAGGTKVTVQFFPAQRFTKTGTDHEGTRQSQRK